MSASVFSTLSGVLTGKHPTTGLLCRETGEVLLPKSGTHPAHWTRGYKDTRGYMRVRFHGKGYLAHRLVAETFLNNPLNLPTVDHISRDKSANFLSNLRFASFKTQVDNRQICEDSKARYGVRSVEDKRAYKRAYYANNPGYAEWCRAREHERCATNPEYAERKRTRNREWREKQRELGKRQRRCPDGKIRRLTDEEYDKRYGK